VSVAVESSLNFAAEEEALADGHDDRIYAFVGRGILDK
jgi:hypothetical protein